MRVVSLFAGIGGIDLGLERAGMTTVAQVENDPWCNQVLEKHWPNVPRWQDIHDVDPKELPDHDLIAGGFPCQPVSLAGTRLAQDDPRWLWPEYLRIVRVVRPRYVLVENVPGLASAGMGDVLGDLAQIGYDCEWQSIPAAFVGAPHLRWRIFIVAYPVGARVAADGGVRGGDAGERSADGRSPVPAGAEVAQPADPLAGGPYLADPADPDGWQNGQGKAAVESDGFVFGGTAGRDEPGDGWWAVEPDVGRVAHGVPSRVDRLRGLGNAVVPQVAELVGRLIMQHAKEDA